MTVQEKSLLEVQALAKAIAEKFEFNKVFIAKSLQHGKVTWRQDKNGEFDVRLELKV